MQRNLKLFTLYTMLADSMAWMPIFFLYFSARLTLAEVIQLGALYYIAVVSLEVPSGYFSDRVGRRLTLLFAAGAFVSAYSIYIVANDFAAFAMGQVALATGMAFRSGTDTAFHYETLHALGRHDEFARREARVKRFSYLASGLAVVAGGVVASINLALAYWLSLATAMGSLVLVVLFREPSRRIAHDHSTGFLNQMAICVDRLRDPLLAWVFAFFVVTFILAHVPYEFYQPYLQMLEFNDQLRGMQAPAVSGVLLGVTMLLGAWAAGYSVRIQDKIGLVPLLLGAAGLQIVIIGILGTWLHAAVIGLLMLRSVPMALIHAPINAAIAPRIKDAQRATYLSIQSLAARLGFGFTLYLVSLGIEVENTDWPTLSAILITYSAFAMIALMSLIFTSRNLNTDQPTSA